MRNSVAPAGDGGLDRGMRQTPPRPRPPAPRAAPGLAAFAVLAALPGVLAIVGALWGGVWPWIALVWIGGASQVVDQVLAKPLGDAAESRRFPLSDALLSGLALLHFLVLVLVLVALTDPARGLAGRIALFLAAGMFIGQVSNATAHELIHRPSRALFRLGAAVYVSMLFGHHASAHRLVHHRHVATDADPNSARLGEGFWHFFPRAWIGAFRAGLRAESARARPGRLNPYVWYLAGAGACCGGVAGWLGWRGLALYLGLSLYAQMQLMLSDYVQHYGLRRRIGPNGRPEPAGPRHSWDAPHPLSGLMMVNAPRHSDHHANPMRAYPSLRLQGEARPLLPFSLPVMAALAMLPPLWRRVMDRRVARMMAGPP